MRTEKKMNFATILQIMEMQSHWRTAKMVILRVKNEGIRQACLIEGEKRAVIQIAAIAINAGLQVEPEIDITDRQEDADRKWNEAMIAMGINTLIEAMTTNIGDAMREGAKT